jgi:N-acetylneuraminic acid mutarotase
MKHLTIVSLLIFICMFFKAASYAQIKGKNSIQWETVAELPAKDGLHKSLGLAGPIAGISNDVLIVAGGANFPDSMPWLGGKKKYYSDVYVLQKGSDNKFSWITDVSLHLKTEISL